MEHVVVANLEAGLDHIRAAPRHLGSLELIVRRPGIDEREVIEEGQLSLEEGLVGDTWRARGSSRTADGSSLPDMQLTLMNARCVALLAQHRDRWPLAGDQLYVDFDLSIEHLPPGSRLSVGAAVIEVSELPHRGCGKFSKRFGLDALRFVNSEEGRLLRLRGLNARVVSPGPIRRDDSIKKL